MLRWDGVDSPDNKIEIALMHFMRPATTTYSRVLRYAKSDLVNSKLLAKAARLP